MKPQPSKKPSTLNALIGKRLYQTEQIKASLAEYADTPAVFYQTSPGDSQKGWGLGKHYPRITYFVDMQADAERKTSGQISINIWCEESGIAPESIEPIVRESLCGIFLTPQDSGITHCLEWGRSDVFEIKESESSQQTQIIGVTMIFDVFAFPSQENTDPDPVLAINEYTKKIIPSCKIIAYDELPEIYSPSAEKPAFYWRFGSMANEKVSWAIAWVTGLLTGHIFAPTTEDRLKWLKVLAQQAVVDEEAIMLDDSPMFFTGLKADSAADYLRTGQISLRVKYGILRKRQRTVLPLNNSHI